MKSSESGFIGNLAGFDQLISAAEGYDKRYNPSNPNLTISALQGKSLLGHQQMANWNAFNSINKAITERRVVLYDPLDARVTSIFNILKSSKPSDEIILVMASLVRKFKGKRAGKKNPPPALGEEPQGPKQISVSQRGYDDRLNNFDKIIRQLELIPEYSPNEMNLTLVSLREYYNLIDAANKAAVKADVDFSNAIISRYKEFHDKETGLVETGKAGKLYIRGIFGARSPEYRQISKISFKTYKK